MVLEIIGLVLYYIILLVITYNNTLGNFLYYAVIGMFDYKLLQYVQKDNRDK
jgi:hypothetical protein